LFGIDDEEMGTDPKRPKKLTRSTLHLLGNDKKEVSRVNRNGNQIIDPGVDLITTMYDNPHGTQTQLAAIGRSDNAGFGLVERDPDLAEKDKLIRDQLKRKIARGGAITRETIEHLVVQPLRSGPVLSRYNRHAELVLDVGIQETEENVHSRVERAKEMERAAAIIPDLDPDLRTQSPVELRISDKSSFMQPLAVPPQSSAQDKGEAKVSHHPDDLDEAERPLKEWKLAKESVLPSNECALTSLKRFEKSISMDEQETIDAKKVRKAKALKLADIDVAAREKILKLFHTCNEFRRHFWAIHPPKSSAERKKQHAIRKGLEEIKQDMQNFRHELLGASILDVVSLLDPQIEQIICAQKAAEVGDKFI